MSTQVCPSPSPTPEHWRFPTPQATLTLSCPPFSQPRPQPLALPRSVCYGRVGGTAPAAHFQSRGGLGRGRPPPPGAPSEPHFLRPFASNAAPSLPPPEGSRSGATMNVEHEISLLVEEIRRLGTKNPNGTLSVKFGVLFADEKCANLFEALVGTLKAAKRRKIVSYPGELLLQGVHDNVDILLLQD